MFKILEIKGKAYFYTLIHCHVCNFVLYIEHDCTNKPP